MLYADVHSCGVGPVGEAALGSIPVAVLGFIVPLALRLLFSNRAGRNMGLFGRGPNSYQEGNMKSRLKTLANWTLDTTVGAIGAGAVAGCLPSQLHN